MITKTFRLYKDKEKDVQVQEALKRHKEYGFDKERSMIVEALYQFIQESNDDQSTVSKSKHNSIDLDEDAFIDKLISRMNSELKFVATSKNDSESGNSPDSTLEDSTDAKSKNVDDVLDFIDINF